MMLDNNQKIFGPYSLSFGHGGVANLVLDIPDSSINVLSMSVISCLNDALDFLSTTEHESIVFSSGKSGFIYGADIHELSGISTTEGANLLVENGWNLMMRIANWPKITIAKIHGFCLGGGLELALACRFRVSSDDKSTKFGLPEVRLGLLPDWGGIMRLPRLIGPFKAFDLILSGRMISAKSAKEMGLVDFVAPLRVLDNVVSSILKSTNVVSPRKFLGFVNRILVSDAFRAIPAYIIRSQLRRKVRFEHYPTPYVILDSWEKFSGNTPLIPEEHPSHVVKLIKSSTSVSLLRVFSLQERLKSYGKDDSIFPIFHIHVVGAGVMGGDVAAWCASKGIRVTLQDLSNQQIGLALKRAHDWYLKKLRDPILIMRAMDLLIPDLRGDGLAHADIVFEAVIEDVDVKRNFFKNFEQRARRSALLVTNTSSIVVERIAEVVSCPGRVAGLHFFNPVHSMPLVEVVRGEKTDSATVGRLMYFVRQIGKLPLPVKSVPGFLVNRVLGPYILGALSLLDSERLVPESIDDAARRFGMPMGPVELADYVGLDVCVAAGHGMSVSDTIPETLVRLVSEKKLGRKTRQGYYSYDEQLKPIRSSKFTSLGDSMVARIVKPLYDWSVKCVEEAVVEDDDLADAGMIFGAGFAPFLGGPLFDLKRRNVK
ncbi:MULTISPECIES: 3-hydroxyacyl-CoA dehydrogenase NAD-binding domain-containing protein [Candidatus Ichthyocystis]|nr:MULTISPECIES: 3-hydroxyacyl-CoA dehydrogenase NAD-binding domain-containing protein [Ichthyocystis]